MPPTYSDINQNHFIFKLFPQKMHDYLLLGRYDRPVGSLLLMFPCWWAATLGTSSWRYLFLQLFIYFIGAVMLRAGGCIINDLWDKHIDQQVERTQTRPLASGKINVTQALIFLSLHLTVGGMIFLWLSPFAKFFCFIATFLFITYPLMKRIFWMPQLWLGLTFNIGILIAWANLFSKIPLTIGIFYIGALFWTIGYDTIYAFQDIEDDRKLQLQSTALLCEKHPKLFISICYLITSLCFFISLYHMQMPYLAAITLILCCAHFYWQVKAWIIADKTSCLKIFKSNITFAGFVFLIFLSNLIVL